MSHEWYGCLKDAPDERDRLYMGVPVWPSIVVPPAVDLRQWLPPVMNQGPIGSCTANATTAAARWHIIKRGTTYDFDMSRLQLYYDSRALEGTTINDAGAQIRDVIKTLANKGVGHEEDWPYDITKFAVAPPQEVYDDAVQYKALVYERVPVITDAIKVALSNNHPVIIGIQVYENFESEDVARHGVVPMPGGTYVGGHCMLAVGYGQRPGYFTVRNSWGDDWGDHGNCYIPEAYLGSSTYGSDYWAISTIGSDDEQKAQTS